MVAKGYQRGAVDSRGGGLVGAHFDSTRQTLELVTIHANLSTFGPCAGRVVADN